MPILRRYDDDDAAFTAPIITPHDIYFDTLRLRRLFLLSVDTFDWLGWPRAY